MQLGLADQNVTRTRMVASAGLFMIVAGLIHIGIGPLHWGHSPAHGLFFLLAGLAQVAWGIAFWRRPSTGLHHAGIVLAGGLITLYAITRLLPAPFSHEPEEVDAFDLVCKFFEGLSLVALLAMGASRAASGLVRIVGWRTLAVFAAVAFGAGWATYGVANAADSVLESIGVVAAHENVETVAKRVASADAAPAWRKGDGDQIELVVAGIATPFVNGSPVSVGKDLMAEFTVKPSDDGRFWRTLDVYLYPADAPASGVGDAKVKASAHMRYMDHGAFQRSAVPVGDGHYLVELPFPMPGEWEIVLEIGARDTDNTLQIAIDILD